MSPQFTPEVESQVADLVRRVDAVRRSGDSEASQDKQITTINNEIFRLRKGETATIVGQGTFGEKKN